jgi:N-acetylmuramoyl-L-alanine amidase
MRRGKTTAIAVLVTALGAAGAWAAVPVPWHGSYVPDPVEFETEVPSLSTASAAVRGSSARTSVSRAVRPGKRFNLVGLTWRGGRISSLGFRVRRDGSDWSRWVAVATDSDHGPDLRTAERRRARRASDPVWAGDADEVQLSAKAGRGVRDLRLSFVNTKGTATPLDRLRTKLRRAAAGTVSAVRALVGAREARADTSQPVIESRAEWGADKCPPRADPVYGEVQLAFIHHTVSANEYGPEDSAAMVLGVCRYHRNTNGWNDLGYNFVVDRYGRIFEGRAGGIAEAVVGAQAQGYNSVSTGIASLGTFSTGGQTEPGLSALARLLSWKLAVHGVPPTGTVQVPSAGGSTNRYPAGARPVFARITGHRDGNATACPGNGLYAQLPRLRTMVDPGSPRAATTTSAERERRNITFGAKAGVRVRLAAGLAPLPGREVEVQVLGRLGWRTNHRLRTDAAGSAATRMRLSVNRSLRARFPGEAGLLGSSSAALTVGVRPLVTAAVPGTSFARGRVPVTGSVRPRKKTAILMVKRRTSSGRLVKVSRRSVALRAGALRTTLRLTRPGTYRLRLSVLRDPRNLSARSPVVEFQVK